MMQKKEITDLAHLARIEMTEKEREAYAEDLVGILRFVEELQSLDATDVVLAGGEPRAFRAESPVSGEREDEVFPPLGDPARLVDAAPAREGEWVEVKALFK